MGYLKSVGTAFIYISLLLALITFLPGLPPNIPFSEYSITPSTDLEEKLAINDRLNGAEFLHVGKFKGPESFDSYNGELYTSIHGGYIVKINEKEIKPFAKFGKECDGIWQEDKCGRPLGLKFDKKGNLYVIDTYYGIFKVDSYGNYEKIIDTSKPIAGKVAKLPNSIDIAENGDIFWTDSSTDFHLYDGVYTLLSNPSGRLLRYNAATKTNEVLLENLAFANGLVLSKDESFVLVLETFASRIIKYNLKGAKAGQKEIFSEGLPGLPDNVHSDNHGGFLVSFILYVDSEHPVFQQMLAPHPYIRKMLVRLLTLAEAPFKLMQDVYPNVYAERIIHAFGSFETTRFLSSPAVLVLRFDAAGKIIDAAYATDGKLEGVSSAFIHKGYLWLGSPFADYVARVPLQQAFPHLAQAEKIHASTVHGTKEHPKMHSTTVKSQTVKTTTAVPTVTTTPKPVTTTARSTVTSNKNTQETVTSQKKVVTSAPSTTVKPSTVPKATTTPKPTTTTAAPPKPSVKTIPKPDIKAPKYENVEQVKVQKKPAVDSSKQNLKTEEKVRTTTSNVKTENTKKTNTKPEANKQKVQNTPSNTPSNTGTNTPSNTGSNTQKPAQ